MRFVEELKRAASETEGRGSRRRRRYLHDGAKELSAAACADDPILAVGSLADKYEDEYEKGAKQADAAEMLSRACQDLARGKDPGPITPIPG